MITVLIGTLIRAFAASLFLPRNFESDLNLRYLARPEVTKAERVPNLATNGGKHHPTSTLGIRHVETQ